jgi:hypothetical protein
MVDQKEYYRKYYLEHKEKYKRPYVKRDKTKANEYQNRHSLKLKTEIFELLGNKCVRCGFTDIRALQIDHIHGKGKQEINSFHNQRQYYKFVLSQIKSGSKNYQILCANCNWIKRRENKE